MRLLTAGLALALASGLATAADLAIGVGGAFTSMDPHFHDLSPNHALVQHVFEALVMADNDARPAPGLALSWRAINELTWEFKLRPGVRWHYGAPFTVDDIVFTFGRAPNVPNSPTGLGQYLRLVTRLEVVDPETIRPYTGRAGAADPDVHVRLHHRQPPPWRGRRHQRLQFGQGRHRHRPVPPELLPTGEPRHLHPQPGLVGAAPALGQGTYRLIANDSAPVAALQSGDVDAIDVVPTRDVARLSQNARLRVTTRPGLRLIYLSPDVGRATTPFATDGRGQVLAQNPLRDLRVRRALSLAINRDGIRSQLMEGHSRPAGQPAPEGAIGYDPTIPPDPYRPDEARRLLATAGLPDGFNLTLHGPNDRYVNDDGIVQAIAQMKARIGVLTQVGTMPASVFFSRSARDEFSIWLTGWSSSTAEPDTSLVQMVATPDPPRGRGNMLRPTHYSNPVTDAILDRAFATIDQSAREALYRDAIRIGYQQDLAVIPIHHQVNIWATRQGLRYTPRLQETTRATEFGPE